MLIRCSKCGQEFKRRRAGERHTEQTGHCVNFYNDDGTTSVYIYLPVQTPAVGARTVDGPPEGMPPLRTTNEVAREA